MGVPPISHSKDSSLENADKLVEYMQHRLGNKRALVSIEHFAQLGYLAGYEVPLSKNDLTKRGQSISLHDHNYADLVPAARERIQKGEIPPNWLLLFHKDMDEKYRKGEHAVSEK